MSITAGIGAGAPNLETGKALRAYTWGRILLGGLALWALAIFVTLVTGIANFLPAIIIVGSFLVPVTFMTWAYDRRQTGEITFLLMLRVFLAGGMLGVLATTVLQSYFLSPSPFLYTGAALVGQAAQVVLLAYLARGLRDRSMRTGMLLGATIGFGFAAFHTVGYGLSALLSVTGQSVRDLTETELLRGVLAPVGPGLWTAIIGGMLFATASSERWQLTSGLVFAYLGVSALQALWDATHHIAVLFTLLLTDTPWQPRLLGMGMIPRPSLVQLHLFTLATFVGYVLIVAICLLWFGILRRHPDGPNAAAAAKPKAGDPIAPTPA
ncbi:MAG TPA: PrsW family glutamic-type intramembrane protease [Actinopolymorphaceae bacterium]|nr:PrsW family glutamic-type intramembrane protease [Actinopolymorphaceae bacterium]